MRIAEILKAIRVASIVGTTDKELKGIEMDSRRVREGGLFVME